MQQKMVKRTAILFAAMSIWTVTAMMAQLSTGKIEGIVRDTDTGQVLAGAQVTVEGTRIGNLTNNDGYYFILNIPPGSRNITFSYTGYQQTTISKVTVLAGQTMTVNANLSSTVVELTGITVEAEADPMIPRDNTVTKRRLSSENMEDIPSTVLADMLVLEAGVQSGGSGARSRGLILRGGRLGEEAMVVDGMMVRNYTANVMGSSGSWHDSFETGTYSEDATPLEMTVGAVEEVDIITGGFQAEYGNAQSGIINVVTKEGGRQFRGRFRYTTDGQQPRTSDWGYNQLSVNVGGPMGIKDLYFNVSGEAQGQEDRSRTHADEGFRSIDQTFINRLNESVRNDPRYEGNPPFSLEALQMGRESYGNLSGADKSLFTAPNPVRLPGAWQDRTMLSGKLTYSPINSLKIITTNNWFRNQYSYPVGGTNDADGNYFRTGIIGRDDPLYKDLFSQRPWKADETEVYIPQSHARRGRTNIFMAGFDWNIMRSAERNMALQFRYSRQRVVEIPSSTLKENWKRDSFLGWTSHDVQYAGETWPERELWAIKNAVNKEELKRLYFPDGDTDWSKIVPIVYPFYLEQESLYHYQYRYLREIQNNYKADLDFQWNRQNRAKMGIFYTGIFNHKYGTGGGYDKEDPLSTFEYNPNIWSVYAQNRTDLGDLVIDYGIRYDTFDPVDNWGTSQVNLGGSKVFVQSHHEWSPRFNIAFPVTDKAQLRFSYGAFTQMPSLDYIFGRSSGGSQVRNRGALEFSRTDAFEGGVSYLLGDQMLLDVVAYYRDVAGNVSDKAYYVDYWDTQKDLRVREKVSGWSNRDSGNIKGVDITLKKRFSDNYSLDLNYTLQFSRTTGSNARSSFYSLIDAATGEVFIEPDELNPIDGDRTHQIKTRFTYSFPRDFRSGTLTGKILQNLRVNAIYEILSGSPSGGSGNAIGGITYGANYFRGKWYTDLNLRLDKGFSLGRSRKIGLFAEIFNTLNRKNHVSYPSRYNYEDNSHVTGGVDVVWAETEDRNHKARFAADFNADGILTVEEAALGNIAHNFMRSTMNKGRWGTARQVRTGIYLTF
jgi:outer membrane receptor for ferrienterochelin and colicin